RPRAEALLPGFQDFRAPCRPVGGGFHRAPVGELERRTVVAEVIGEFSRRREGRRELRREGGVGSAQKMGKRAEQNRQQFHERGFFHGKERRLNATAAKHASSLAASHRFRWAA